MLRQKRYQELARTHATKWAALDAIAAHRRAKLRESLALAILAVALTSGGVVTGNYSGMARLTGALIVSGFLCGFCSFLAYRAGRGDP